MDDDAAYAYAVDCPDPGLFFLGDGNDRCAGRGCRGQSVPHEPAGCRLFHGDTANHHRLWRNTLYLYRCPTLLVFWLLLPNVVAWLYSIGTLLGLILDKQFQASFQRSRFNGQVKAIKEPFYIVCGLGNTGYMTVSGLLARGIHAVVIEVR